MNHLFFYKKHALVGLIIISIAAFTVPVLAAGQGSTLELPNPLNADSIPQLIAGVFKSIVQYVAPPIAAVMIIVGAFQMLTAGGNPEKFALGKKTILYTVMGLVVVLLGMVLAQLVAEILGANDAAQQIQQIRTGP